MKKDIHPEYHKITVKLTNGETFETCSTWGKEGETMQLDVDSNTHPAWVGGGAFINEKASKVAKFNTRFSGIGMSAKKVKQQAEEAAKRQVEERAKAEEEARANAEAEADAKMAGVTPEEELEEAPAEESGEAAEEEPAESENA